MTALQVIIKEAKAIRKKNPKMEWKKAVAQASAIYASKHKGKSPIGKKKAAKKIVRKKAAKKRIGKVDTKLKKQLKSQGKKMPHGYDVVKRTPRKKIGAVSKKATTMHKDTKSHNVNIRVMSGIGGHAIDRIKSCMSHLHHYNTAHSKYMAMPLKDRKKYASEIKKIKHLIKETKTHISQLKRSI
jgi:hypothetical protein